MATAFAVCGSLLGAPLHVQQQQRRRRRWRVAASSWRRECGELRVQVHELRGALMRDEVLLLELESLVSSLAAARAPAVRREVSVRVEIEDEDAMPEMEEDDDEEDEVYKDAVMLSELRSEELRSKQEEGLSTMRRLKTLNVHEYVHNALRESHLRSWLNSRGIAE